MKREAEEGPGNVNDEPKVGIMVVIGDYGRLGLTILECSADGRR